MIQIRKCGTKYSGILFSHKKGRYNLAICNNMMELEQILLREISQEKDKYDMISLIQNINKQERNRQNQTKTNH